MSKSYKGIYLLHSKQSAKLLKKKKKVKCQWETNLECMMAIAKRQQVWEHSSRHAKIRDKNVQSMRRLPPLPTYS